MREFLLCVHPLARGIVLAVAGAGISHVLLTVRLGHQVRWFVPAIYLAMLAAVLWLGSFGLSPLWRGRGGAHLLRAFQVTRPQRGTSLIAPGQTVLVAAGTPMEIEPLLLPVPDRCAWASSNGGAFEDPAQCTTAYQPGDGATYDFVHVHIVPACGLPAESPGIRISVLP